uniref:Uncharacterized protein n=1 Tax=Colobus angolensis palliatus TaxID=336983 RepID=A0A2K5I0B1_COLAP
MCVEELLLFVMYWYKQIQYKLTNTDLKIMHIQCSNLNLSHGFLWCGPICTLCFSPKMFFPVYPIMDTGFVNYDSLFSLFILGYSSNAITEMNDFLFLKCNH